MLSRFTKLPGISSLLSNTNNYSPESIDEAVADIKKLGRSVSSNVNADIHQCISQILFLMKKFSDSVQVQRVSCHSLSNLGMQVATARWIIKKGGFQLIKKALTKFETDNKLCWLGSSAGIFLYLLFLYMHKYICCF